MKTNETILGEIFIIPNASICAAVEQPTRNFRFWADLEDIWLNLSYVDKIIDNEKKMYDESWVQVWFCTPGNPNSNWKDHLIDGHDDLAGWEPRCSYLPKSLFENKKEGDVVTFTLPICRKAWRANVLDRGNTRVEHDSIKVSLSLAQLKHRYRNFGSFEEVLKTV